MDGVSDLAPVDRASNKLFKGWCPHSHCWGCVYTGSFKYAFNLLFDQCAIQKKTVNFRFLLFFLNFFQTISKVHEAYTTLKKIQKVQSKASLFESYPSNEYSFFLLQKRVLLNCNCLFWAIHLVLYFFSIKIYYIYSNF